MRLTVTDRQGSSINGTLSLEGPGGLADRSFTGAVDSAGVLSIAISEAVVVCGVTPATTRLTWRSQIGPGDTMSGAFTYVVPNAPLFCGDPGTTFPFTTESQVQAMVRQPR